MRSTGSLVGTLVVLGLLSPARPLAAAQAAEPPSAGPVVIELFTSQGCSSCPRADEVVSRLGLAERTRGLVIPLAFHVDYWNQIGWTDPFSSYAWSLRQGAYCRALKVQDGPYTPQLVVGGQAELNGGQERSALEQVSAALERPSPATVKLEASQTDEGKPGLAVSVTADVGEGVEARKLQLLVAIYENGLVTRVANGENGGRSLHNDFVVRHLETAFSFEPRKESRRQREMKLKLHRDWKRENLGVAAFLQDPASMRIYAAAALPPAAAATTSQ